ncbi:RNA polymerase sigma factor [Reticulibacter mediterranei]|uniref:RNA polymerase sigma factor n=1 Tax=Reticulibacter mediterranei TaxID=2778369 RepID=A0A8J3N0K1_9CHLR|nr:RNA polymerase subunit sigma-70 [Reticulibacter mediterranei]GHO90362.1 RNA polymerase sigma factor [Reticulibacter mediterranei]
MNVSPQIALVLAAQAGDQAAFETLAGAYRRELLVHCYRMLGSLSDAEDQVQETLLRAWEKRATLTSPQSYRAWLYRIATNLCLNRLRSVSRRSLPSDLSSPSKPGDIFPPGKSGGLVQEPVWLEPFPDELLVDQYSNPEDQALRQEQISLAFLVALQHLTPVQRAVLLLREVLEWKAAEVAEWLDLSVPAVNSALQRARQTLHQHYQENGSETSVVQLRPQLQNLLDRYMTLWQQADVPGLVALLREDAWLTMPPFPAWVAGRMDIATLLQFRVFIPGRQWRLQPTHANGCPAFGLYRREVGEESYRLSGLWVLGVEGEQISSIVAFLDVASFTAFGLPSTIEREAGGQEA